VNVSIKHFGLLGKTLQHSFSKDFFEDFFRKNDIVARYTNFELSSEEQIPKLLSQHLSGLNVTLPYKKSICPFLDELSPEAQQIGAVNCVEFVGKKKIGHNTDAYGFHQLIKPYLTKEHHKALILGTGGAASAVEYVLKNIGIECIFISRKPQTNKQFTFQELNKYMLQACKLIVNCTPLGMYPNVNESPPIPFQYLTEKHCVVDLIYNPTKTILLQESEKMNAQILNGQTMLVQQALKSWEIWKATNTQ